MTTDHCQPPAPHRTASSIKARQQAMWASGDFAVIGTTLQIVGELLCEAVDIRSASACSTWRPATATRRWRRRAASRRSRRPTTCPRCSNADAPRRGGGARRRRSRSPTPRRCPSRTRASTSCCRRSASCSRPITRPSAARDAARVPARRPHRPGVVDAGGLPRRQMFRVIAAHVPPTARRAVAAAVGHRRAHRSDLFAGAASIAHTARHFAFRYRVGGALRRDVPHVLRPGAQGVRGARRRRPGGARGRHARAAARGRDRGDAAGLVVPAEYLETVIVR